MGELIRALISGKRTTLVFDEGEKACFVFSEGEQSKAVEVEKFLLGERRVFEFFLDAAAELASAPLAETVSDFEELARSFSEFRESFFAKRAEKGWLAVLGRGRGRLLLKDAVIYRRRVRVFSREIELETTESALSGCFDLLKRLLDCLESKIDTSLNHFSILTQMLAAPEGEVSLLALSSVSDRKFVMSGAVFSLSDSLEWSFRLARPPSISLRGLSVRTPLLSRDPRQILQVLDPILERVFSRKEEIEDLDREEVSKEIQKRLSFVVVSELRGSRKKETVF